MVIRYPNGKAFNAPPTATTTAQKSVTKKEATFSNRGKTLEDDLDETNRYYLLNGIASIHKKPVPIQIVKVEYPKRSAAVIREAYFRTPSTTDYNGVWNSYYIDFEAKETESATSFPLKNIHAHQIEHLKQVVKQNGIAFFIVKFASLNKHFVTPFYVIENAWQTMLDGGRKSIPLAIFEQHGYEVPVTYSPRIDYLQAVQQLIDNQNKQGE